MPSPPYPYSNRAAVLRTTRSLVAGAALASIFLLSAGAATGATPNAPAQLGQWEAPFATPDVFVHAMVMRNGNVLGVGLGSNNQYTLNPLTHASTPAPVATNVECGGQTFLWDGRAITGGGGGLGPGIVDVNIFDPLSVTWTSAAPMNFARWYPTSVEMPDGRILVVSGYLSSDSNIVRSPRSTTPVRTRGRSCRTRARSSRSIRSCTCSRMGGCSTPADPSSRRRRKCST